MALTVAQLVVPQSVTYYFNLILSVYQGQGFPVQSWQPGGVERTRAMAFATALADRATNYAPQIAAGILLDFSTSPWLPLTASEFYNLPQNLATFTQGSIVLTAAAGVAQQTLPAGQLIAVFAASGLRYLNSPAAVTIPAGPGSVTATFQAENPGSLYADPSNSGALTLVTPIPGVTLTNPASTYTQPTHTGSGSGTLTLAGSPVGPHSVVITITGTGQSGAASWSYSLDGAAAVSAGTVATLTNLGGVGINVTLVNGSSGTSFVNGDTYSFGTPGSWITSQGGNIESDFALAQRCRNRWTSLSAVPTQGFYQLLATSTPSTYSTVTHVGAGAGTIALSGAPSGSHAVVITITTTGAAGTATWSYTLDGGPSVPAGPVASLLNIGGFGINVALSGNFTATDTYSFNVVGNQVTQVVVANDSIINNLVHIIVAGAGGVLPAATITAIQSYISPRSHGTDNPVVQSPTMLNVTLAGTITLQTSQSAAAQTAIQTAMTNYVGGAPINGTIQLSTIIELIMLVPGVVKVNVPSMTINSVAADLVLGSSTSFVLASLQPLAFSYINQ